MCALKYFTQNHKCDTRGEGGGKIMSVYKISWQFNQQSLRYFSLTKVMDRPINQQKAIALPTATRPAWLQILCGCVI